MPMGDDTPRSRLWQVAIGLGGIAATAYVGDSKSMYQVDHITAVAAVAALCLLAMMLVGVASRRRSAVADEAAYRDEALRHEKRVDAKTDEIMRLLERHGDKLDEHHDILDTLQRAVIADGELNISNAHSRLVHEATKYTYDRAGDEYPHGWCTQDEQDGWFRDYEIYERRCSQMGIDNDVLDDARRRMLAVRIRSY